MRLLGILFYAAVGVFLLLPWLLGITGLPASFPLGAAALWDYPGIAQSIAQTLIVGVLATLASCGLASLILYVEQCRPSPLWSATFTAPHLAFAVAFLWLFTPFGWFDRLLPGGWVGLEQQSITTLIVILILKETPFLVVLGRQQLQQLPVQQWLLQGQSLAASHWHSWWLIIFPAWLKSMRLLLIAVAIYSVGVVDIATVAGPMNPPLIGPLLVSWQQQFDAASQLLAAQGLWLLVSITGLMIAWVYLQEQIVRRLARWRLGKPRRKVSAMPQKATDYLVHSLRWLFFAVSIATGLALLALSVGSGWFYPALGPTEWSLTRALTVVQGLLPQLLTSLSIALCTAVVVVMLLVVAREWQRARGRDMPDLVFIAALTLPQAALVLAWLHSEAYFIAGASELQAWGLTFYAHAWFAFAYAYLSYAPAERAQTQAHLLTGCSLGFSFWRSWWYFKRPALHAALAYAFLVSFLVSIALYVPTLLLGQGYVSTLTTELVVLSSGAELRAPAVAALLLWLLALLAITLLGNGVNAWIKRRGRRLR